MQQVRINTGFSEKVVANFQSTQHSISLEMDVSVNGTTKEIEDASAKLFALCRKIVSAQKSGNVDNLLTSPTSAESVSSPVQPAPAASAPSAPHAPTGTNGTKPATSKQIKYALELMKKSGMSKQEIATIPASFNKQSFEALSSVEASQYRAERPIRNFNLFLLISNALFVFTSQLFPFKRRIYFINISY